MKAYVAVTDDDWYRFLAARPHLTEANFWLPSGGPQRYGLKAGEPMLFKTHHPHNRLVGGGFLSDYRRLPLSVAWEWFGEANGCRSEAELRAAIGAYRKSRSGDDDPLIGCVMLRDTAFLPLAEALPAPDDFAKNIVTVKGYALDERTQPQVEAAFARLMQLSPTGLIAADLQWLHEGPMFGAPRPVAPRLGQSAFAAAVTGAYGMRCAITGAKVLPVLQAAHIRPVSKQGEHRVDNGLLLRADVHIMFDKGFLSVDPRRRTLLVSQRIRETYGNGQEFYALEGAPIADTERRADRPNAEFLEWHREEVFKG